MKLGARRSYAQASYQGICQHGRTGETGSQGIKDRSATLDQHTDPDNCEPADTIPGAPAHPQAGTHRAAAAVRRGQARTLTPGLPHHLRRNGCRHENRLRTDRMTVASDTANALPS